MMLHMGNSNLGAVNDTKLSFETRDFGELTVVTHNYTTGNALGIELIDEEGESCAILSVNLPEHSHLLGAGEFFAKTWSENARLAEDALASGIFEYTGRKTGYALIAPIWKFS